MLLDFDLRSGRSERAGTSSSRGRTQREGPDALLELVRQGADPEGHACRDGHVAGLQKELPGSLLHDNKIFGALDAIDLVTAKLRIVDKGDFLHNLIGIG